jgi:predicted nucleic acid-binding Zn ribbon protein
MERVARLIKNKKVSREMVTDEDVARAVWPAAVGKAIAAHTSRLKLVRNTLVVEVEDAIWQKQLFVLSHQILRSLHKMTGPSCIEAVEFRIGVPRRVPQRAGSHQADSLAGVNAPYDDAETIQDPVLKKVYRLSRKRATA